MNTVCPTVVYTPMLDYLMGMGQAYFQEVGRLCGASTVFPGLDALDVRDVSEAVLWLASPAARYVRGSRFRSTAASRASRSRAGGRGRARSSVLDAHIATIEARNPS